MPSLISSDSESLSAYSDNEINKNKIYEENNILNEKIKLVLKKDKNLKLEKKKNKEYKNNINKYSINYNLKKNEKNENNINEDRILLRNIT